MKKLFVLILGLLALAGTVRAQFFFTTNNGVITITQYTGPDGSVIIPSTTNVWPVAIIGASAFKNLSAITNVTIPNSITNIGANAFYWCTALTNVSIGNEVIDIGASAFYNCYRLLG